MCSIVINYIVLCGEIVTVTLSVKINRLYGLWSSMDLYILSCGKTEGIESVSLHVLIMNNNITLCDYYKS